MRNTLLHPSLWISVIGSLISIVGTCVLALSLFRRKRTDATLLTFGATSLLYGLRLLLDAWAQQYVAIEPPRLLFYLMAFISYVIVIPLSGFLLHIFGKGWRNSLLWIFRGSMVFACAGILSDVVQAVATGRVPNGVLPIESSLVGPVAETHDLLYESPLSIVAEANLPVNHCLVGPAVVALSEVREIHLHPVALDQCRRLLASLPNAVAVAAPTTGDAASINHLPRPPVERHRIGERSVAVKYQSFDGSLHPMSPW